MTREEAGAFVVEWQQAHKWADLAVQDGDTWSFTMTGKRAVNRLVHYDLDTVQDCAADAELEATGKSVRLSHVLNRLPKTVVASPLPSKVTEMGNAAVVRLGEDLYGTVELCDPPVLWVLQQRFWMGHRMKPEWTVMPPNNARPDRISLVDPLLARQLREKWWKMEQGMQFECSGPWRLYCPHDGQLSGNECLKILSNWTTPRMKQEKLKAPVSIAAAMSPGLAKKPVVEEPVEDFEPPKKDYTPGEHIGWSPDPDDPLPF